MVGILGQVLDIDGPGFHLLLVGRLERFRPGHLLAILRQLKDWACYHAEGLLHLKNSGLFSELRTLSQDLTEYLCNLRSFLLSDIEFCEQSSNLVETQEGLNWNPGIFGVDLGQELGQAEVGVAEVELHLSHKPSVGALPSLSYLG